MLRAKKCGSPAVRGAGGARPPGEDIRFELEPHHYGLTDRELLEDLRRAAEQIGTRRLTMQAYDRVGRFAGGTIRRRFGAWNHALAGAGLVAAKRTVVTPAAILQDLRRASQVLKTRAITRKQYFSVGGFGATTVSRYFGKWTTALCAAGLTLHRAAPGPSDRELFENLEMLWRYCGRQPRGSDVVKPLSRFCLNTYKDRFGGIRPALKAFVQDRKSREELQQSSWRDARPLPRGMMRHKTPRNVNWRLRYMILQRDHFRCCACGRSPATHRGVALHIDHIKAWSAGGETLADNLQTLCAQCNGGKGIL